MNDYKSYEKLKEELGDNFDDYMYKSNIELLTKIDKAAEYINKKFVSQGGFTSYEWNDLLNELLLILKGK